MGDALGQTVGRAALGAVAGAIVILTLGFVAELVRRRAPAHRVLALLDLTVPIGVRTAIVSLLALLATMTGPRPAAADDSVRGWLGQVSTTTTPGSPVASPPTTSAPGSTSTTSTSTTSTTAIATTRPSGPVVLIPPSVVEQPETTPPPVTAPVTSAPTAAVPPSAARPVHVVRRGDCLWSIAAGLLGPGSTATAIDAGWRRIYDANRAAIGDNPNLIHIGLVLTLPPLDAQP